MSDWKFEPEAPLSPLEAELRDNPTLDKVAQECYSCAIDHGFPLQEKLPQIVAFVDEVGEWCGAVRKGDTANEQEEVVDMIVRLFAYAKQHFDETWIQALFSKMNYNRGRPYKHGKKF